MNFKSSLAVIILSSAAVAFANCTQSGKSLGTKSKPATAATSVADTAKKPYPKLDKARYDTLMKRLANGDTTGKWPVKNTPYPIDGAILPFNRVVAFYGNLYSKKMGILGELPAKEMLAKLKGEVKSWEKADPKTPVIPALHYICVTAQGAPGKDGLHNLRMPFKQIDTILSMAKKINAIVFLDFQVGFSNVQTEIPRLEKYLSMPNVHLAIDPEFSMKEGSVPGKRIGMFKPTDINFSRFGKKIQPASQSFYCTPFY